MDAGIWDYGSADTARSAAHGGDKTFAEDRERETGAKIFGALGRGDNVEVLRGCVSGRLGAGGGDVERKGDGRGWFPSRVTGK